MSEIIRITLGKDDDSPSWLLDLGEMKCSEGELCEQLTGWDSSEWVEALFSARARAVKFAVYLAMYRAGDNPEWKDLDFDMLALKWEPLDDEGKVVAPPDKGMTEDEAAEGPTGPPVEEQPPLDAA